jgi:micrococcal nuclease
VAALVAGALLNRELGGSGAGEPGPDPRIAQVVEVVDGDTIRVQFVSGTIRTVSYIGIDAPDTRAAGADEDECFGPEATAANRRLTGVGTRVRLEYDRRRQDRQGHLLAYVYRAADDSLVNGRLLANGYARILTSPPNVRQVDTLLTQWRRARDARRGLWQHCPT